MKTSRIPPHTSRLPSGLTRAAASLCMKGKPDEVMQFIANISQCFSVPDSAKETFTTLRDCSTTISTSCQVTEGIFNQTNLDLCAEKFAAVKRKSKECYGLVTAQVSPVCEQSQT